ncbi:copper chaperone PCu(A)C [Microbulbifer hydrolyticus]|uniref:Copper chaperone PCu(A)C n=1 Tax=Microbulbifer hydrolyticus TaxID=48074 RepID=A0A6P1TC18_9GAMM|nr:copper chaperone PCu(A)C [Microbulbifer hydrolyticus]MBB5212948.1 copper(I)-binding protein [Microbulbifer hydrolyticus]QHQ40318.1 copper chaperone PCu(A)C [Microbulbifer hydrolyticus]
MKRPFSGFDVCALVLLLSTPVGGVAAAESAQGRAHLSAPTAAEDLAAGLEVSGYAREMPPGAPMGAAYVTLRDLSGVSRVLGRVELPAHPGGKVEMHATQQVDGISRMRALEKLSLPGNGTIEMRPGATHLMVHGVALKAGDVLPLRLVFADGSNLEVKLPVRAPDWKKVKESPKQGAGHHHAHHDHG